MNVFITIILFRAIHKSRESGITEEKVEEANTKPEVKPSVTMGFDVSTNPTTKRKGTTISVWYNV